MKHPSSDPLPSSLFPSRPAPAPSDSLLLFSSFLLFCVFFFLKLDDDPCCLYVGLFQMKCRVKVSAELLCHREEE